MREDIPSKELNFLNMPENIENIFIEINLFKVKWLVSRCYHPRSQEDQYFFNHLDITLDKYTQNYEEFSLVGDFNAEDIEPCLSEFLYEHNAKSIVKENTSQSTLGYQPSLKNITPLFFAKLPLKSAN